MSDLLYVKALEAITDRVRTDITALKKDGMMVWTKQSLTPARMVAHLKGEAARGCCPIKAGGSTVRCALLDLDSHKGETSQSVMFKTALDISNHLKDFYGLFSIPWRSSGGRGIHLYFLWNDDQDAYSVRRVLTEALKELGYKNGTGGVVKNEIEIFPKQDFVAEDGNGSQFILPLAGKSEPIDLELGIELGREHVLEMEWPISHNIEKMERPVRAPSKAPSGNLAHWAQYLYAIDPNELTYQDWLEVVGFGLHYECDGSEEGFELWDEWSSQSGKYRDTEYGRYKWESIRNDKTNNITGQSIINLARAFGYNLDYLADFDDETNDSEIAGTSIPNGSGVVGSPTKSISRSDFGSVEEYEEFVELTAHGATSDEKSISEVKQTIVAAVGEAKKPWPKLTMTKAGERDASISNVIAVLSRPDLTGWEIKLDRFRDEIMALKNGAWLQFTDDDYTDLRTMFESKLWFKPVGRELMRDAVAYVARRNSFDSAIAWLEGVEAWDGVERIDTFLQTYMGAVGDAYTQAVSAYMWTALAGRVLSPGCQVDMVPILEGAQGVRKTSAVKAMVPHKELFCGISFNEKEDDLARKMRGRLIGEIGELKGLHSRELETIKDFVTRTDESWIPKFKEFGTTFPRRLVFIGTTNQKEFLSDDSGNRRWLPVHVEWCDTDAIVRDRNQLWAEARDRFKAGGVAFAEAEQLAGIVHAEYMMHDAWEDKVTAWLDEADLEGKMPKDCEFLMVGDVLSDALHFDTKGIKRTDEVRIGKILRKLGYEKGNKRVDGRLRKVWINMNDALLV